MVNAGWQPDPTGRHQLRHYDGARWTEHVADAGVQSLDPLPAPPIGPAPMPGSMPGSMPGPGAGPWEVSGWSFAPVQEHPDGTLVLILGILGLVVCGLVGPFAWWKGTSVLAEMDRQPTITWTNRGQVRAGQICGIITTCLLAFGAVILLLVIVVAATGSSNGTRQSHVATSM